MESKWSLAWLDDEGNGLRVREDGALVVVSISNQSMIIIPPEVVVEVANDSSEIVWQAHQKISVEEGQDA